jgi:DNA-binding NtrC family response regulator
MAVRELRNRVERAVALARQPWIMPGDLFPEIGRWRDAVPGTVAPLSEVKDAAERRQILRALQATGGQIMKAAELLGVSRTTLWEKMRRLKVDVGGPAG